MINNKKFFSLFLILVLSLLIVACTKSQEPGVKQQSESDKEKIQKTELVMDITLAGGSASGFWSAIGEAVGRTITSAHPRSSFALEVGSGVGNIALIKSNQVELGLVQGTEAKAALEGLEVFDKPVSNLQAIATVYNNGVYQVIARKAFLDKYGIKSLKDIKEKKPPIVVVVNQQGNFSEVLNRALFEIYGFTYDDIKSWGGDVLFLSGPKALELMKDGRADLTGLPVQAPTSFILEASTSLDLVMMELDEHAIAELEKRWATPRMAIPASAYKFMDRNIDTVSEKGMVMISSEISKEDAYLITKAMVENIDMLRNVGKAMAELTPEIMANTAPLQLHPGAEKYYREVGLIK